VVTILLEGDTDKSLVESMLKELKLINKKFEFKGQKGISSVKKLIPTLEAEITKGNKIIAIVDADNDFDKRKKEMEELKHIENDNIDLFILPNNRENGTLEDLLLSTIEDRSIFDCIEKYKDCLESERLNTDSIDSKTKLYAYTTITHDKIPNKCMDKFDFKHKNFNELKQKLKNLFKEEANDKTKE
jgi:Cft2 family RNA processing exonuclease